MSLFLVDTNFFIQAHRLNYPLDVVPSFWNKVKQLAEENKIISLDKVRNEIFKNDDELKSWCQHNLPNNFFKESSSIVSSYSQIVNWAINPSLLYLPNAISEFLNADEADAWLLAYALSDKSNLVIVTHELSQPQRKSKIKIPDVCIAFDIRYANTIEMFRQIGEKF